MVPQSQRTSIPGIKVDIIAGARPNFMKVAALYAVVSEFPELDFRLIHTGQHYDKFMSDVFLQDLELPKLRCHLGSGSDSHAYQTAKIMMGYEDWVREDRPDLCLVVGDVNSTVACALVAAKSSIQVAHVEAGLRSFDRTMPEEINRTLTDSLADLMFVTEPAGVKNLEREGRPPEGIHLVGNTMIDTMLRLLPRAEKLGYHRRIGVKAREYAYLTLHRPSNVDHEETLQEICEQLLWLCDRMSVVFPVHPRTKKRLEATGWYPRLQKQANLYMSEPRSYLDSLALVTRAKLVVTDSGGLQEETAVLRIPCLTVRSNTERPITLEAGTNTLIGGDWTLFQECVQQIDDGEYPRRGSAIPFWDGKAGERILKVISSV